jgi:hypothetical protein
VKDLLCLTDRTNGANEPNGHCAIHILTTLFPSPTHYHLPHKNMFVGFTAMFPFDADARRKYLDTFTKEAAAFYNNKCRHWPAFPMNVNRATGRPGIQVAVYVGGVVIREKEVLDRPMAIRQTFGIPALK